MADLRRCIGSAKFGIAAHEASPDDFPVQPSQKDGLGRMCKPHWNQYTTALRKAALAHKGEEPAVVATQEARTEGVGGRRAKVARAAKPEPIRTRSPLGRRQAAPQAGSQGDAG